MLSNQKSNYGLLPESFFLHKDVCAIARQLLGIIMVTEIDHVRTAGRIVEAEAYSAISDRASHAYGGRRTARNEHMYGMPGTSYVYICYGVHPMVNVVTNEHGIPDAVLIRALEPVKGITVMAKRTGKAPDDKTITKGPGNLCRAMGIDKTFSGLFLQSAPIYLLHDPGFIIEDHMIGVSRRIGVEGAGEDAALPYRFYIRGNKYVSGSPRT